MGDGVADADVVSLVDCESVRVPCAESEFVAIYVDDTVADVDIAAEGVWVEVVDTRSEDVSLELRVEVCGVDTDNVCLSVYVSTGLMVI